MEGLDTGISATAKSSFQLWDISGLEKGFFCGSDSQVITDHLQRLQASAKPALPPPMMTISKVFSEDISGREGADGPVEDDAACVVIYRERLDC
jgi:hypothetical protein